MSVRTEIEKRIERKRRELVDLEQSMREARVYIQALEDTLKILPREGVNDGSADSVLRPNSNVARARDAILRAGSPLHVSAILETLQKPPTKSARAAISGALGAYVRRGEIFTRPAPNTFGLVELGTHAPDEEPPGDFGLDDDMAFHRKGKDSSGSGEFE